MRHGYQIYWASGPDSPETPFGRPFRDVSEARWIADALMANMKSAGYRNAHYEVKEV